MAERSPSGTPQRRTATTPRIPRPRRADHDTIGDNPDTDDTTSAPAPVGALVRYLTDPAIEEAIQAFVATAPPMSEVKRAKLARLLGTDRCNLEPRD
ncbi:hypothetical protein HDA40_005474 [Hamadaea flava]|uniref:Uncharacterized protein n=1 Tax=Hamadaea flava TaxID=1742688 RepID=A0ABV8LZA9_9ACTN|nr:hypothetical protein [Hamadaea flava]MCP2326967.1 hypothetical protein [Hamadaea flava]